ncbi:MAG: STAS domain-containing protein [Planctomycetes bacterium]|nr:STAS domain-containing protein [Planctomycetota bacterium]
MNAPDEQLIQISPREDALVLSVQTAQLTTLPAVDEFDQTLRQLLESRSELIWVIDFRNVTFMVSPAVSTLIVVMKRLRVADGDLILTGLHSNIQRLFELMRLDQVLTICPDVDSALAAIRRSE